MKRLANAINWVEIPAADLERAREFYEALLEIEMHQMSLANGLKMALFPVDEGGVGGALCEHQEFYHPATRGRWFISLPIRICRRFSTALTV